MTFVNASTLYADFGPGFSPTGTCDVTVTSGTHSDQLPGAVTFSRTFAPYGIGSVPQTPTVSVVSPSINRPNVDSEVVVNYSNPYPYEIPAPLMELDAEGATLHFPDQPAGDASSLPILGTAPAGDPGVLAPGGSGSVDVLFDSTMRGTVSFSVGVISQPAAPADLGSLLAAMLPAGTDPAVVAYVTAQGGTESAAQLQATLDADATYLSTLPEPIPDAEGLFAYELNKITDYGQVVARHSGGPFGDDLPGLVDSATVDMQGNVTVTDAAGDSTEFAALPGGGYAPPAGVQSTLTAASGGGWVMSQTDGATATFDATGQLTSTADAYGNTTGYTYSAGNLTSVAAPSGDVTTYTYDAAGEVTSSSDSRSGQAIAYSYDANGRLAGVSTEGTTEKLTWNASSNVAVDGTLASFTNAAGVTDTYSYDSQGRPTAVRRSDGTTLDTFAYPADATVALTDAAGNTTSEYLDPAGAVTSAVLADGTDASTSFDGAGEPVSQTLGSATSMLAYDGDGDVTSGTDALGQQTSLTYSSAGVLSGFTEPAGPQTTIATNSGGDPTAITGPDGTVTSITYTPSGQVAAETDADGNRTSFAYDASGDLTTETLPGGAVDAFAYDSDDRLTSASDSAGTTSYTYDAAGRIVSVTYPTGLGISFTYDGAGRRTTATTTDGYSLGYHYDSVGRLASLTDAHGAAIVSYTYTADDQPQTVTNGNGTTTSYAYDSRGTVSSVVNRGPGGAVTSQFAYTHNALGETTSVTGSAGTTTYSYDADGELTMATLPGGRVLRYSYDADGNRTATTDSTAGPTNYAVNGDDEYTSAGATTYTYDADGNLASATGSSGTTTYHWNPLGQLASVVSPSGTTTYSYDALGTLISEDVAGTTTNMLDDPGDGTLLGQYSAADAPLHHYPVGIGVVGQAGAGGATSYYGFDGSGDVVSLSAPNGATADTYQYLPFGQPSATTGTDSTPFRFAGQFGITTDPATGLTQNGARDYDPGSGRFISQDSVLLSAPNPYEYAGNDPLDNVDITGHGPVSDFLADAWNGGLSTAGNAAAGFVTGFTGDWSGVFDGGAGSPTVQVAKGGAATLSAFSTLTALQGVLPGATPQLQQSSAVLGNLLTAGSNAVNIGVDIDQARNGSSVPDRNKGIGNIVLHTVNVGLELGFADIPFFGQVLEGSEAALD